MRHALIAALVGVGAMLAAPAGAAELKVLTAGAFKEILLATVPDFEKATGHKVTLVNANAKLIQGGAVAEHIAKGEAELGLHQISEILPVKGVTLVGPLPAEIQNYTVYAAGVGAAARDAAAARALVARLSGPETAAV